MNNNKWKWVYIISYVILINWVLRIVSHSITTYTSSMESKDFDWLWLLQGVAVGFLPYIIIAVIVILVARRYYDGELTRKMVYRYIGIWLIVEAIIGLGFLPTFLMSIPMMMELQSNSNTINRTVILLSQGIVRDMVYAVIGVLFYRSGKKYEMNKKEYLGDIQ